jgi:hypothetical protein
MLLWLPCRESFGWEPSARRCTRKPDLSLSCFTKGGLILGVGRGDGVLTFRGRRYPFTVSGMSVGATIGASTTRLVGQALNLQGPVSIEGTYTAIGAGGALAGGAGTVRLRNTNGAMTNGVILQLSGPKVGVELSVAAAGVSIRLK